MTQTRVDRLLSSPQRVDVGMIGGKTGRHLGTLGNGPVAGASRGSTTCGKRQATTVQRLAAARRTVDTDRVRETIDGVHRRS